MIIAFQKRRTMKMMFKQQQQTTDLLTKRYGIIHTCNIPYTEQNNINEMVYNLYNNNYKCKKLIYNFTTIYITKQYTMIEYKF